MYPNNFRAAGTLDPTGQLVGTVLIYKIYKCLHDQSPNYMYRLRYVNDFNNYATRNSTDNMLYVPKQRVDIFKQEYQYTAPVHVCYNDLPHDIKMHQSLDTFKY